MYIYPFWQVLVLTFVLFTKTCQVQTVNKYSYIDLAVRNSAKRNITEVSIITINSFVHKSNLIASIVFSIREQNSFLLTAFLYCRELLPAVAV